MRISQRLAAVVVAVFTAGVTTGVTVGVTVAAPAMAARSDGPSVDLPSSIAALGDSITRGFNACGFYRDCTRRSWSTGDDGDVGSHRLRLQDAGVALADQSNLARTGAKSDALPGQAQRAVAMQAQYVTIEIGANDACRRSPDDMTSLEDYRQHITEALAILQTGLPHTRIFIASIPDLRRLWAVGHTSWYVRKAWNQLGVCQSMLKNPGSLAQEDVDRRDRVRTRTILYNEILAQACADYGPLCRFDDKAVFLTNFTRGQISKWDFFHPSTSGQRLLAQITWEHSFFGVLAHSG
ncbi:MAG TPA: SGNH/GDSL hydrolase family protein [Sporichthya sp.]|nr:SGNH/GDSL hydrolase family protein [Sporichthya sp.]